MSAHSIRAIRASASRALSAALAQSPRGVPAVMNDGHSVTLIAVKASYALVKTDGEAPRTVSVLAVSVPGSR